jgi:hypothetical protein
MQTTGHWRYKIQNLEPERAVGFVYIIIDKKTGEAYLGKKQFVGRGKLNKGQQSNWKNYTSSSRELNNRIKERGKDDFIFVILEQYFTVGGWSFAEIWSQVIVESPSNNDRWLNRFIDKCSWAVKESVTKRHKQRLKLWNQKSERIFKDYQSNRGKVG